MRIAPCCLLLLVGSAPLLAQEGSPAGPVPVPSLEARRANLAHRLGDGIAIVRSGSLRSIEGDYPQDSDYRERNAFFYLTGLETPEATLVIVAKDSSLERTMLFLPARNAAAERWTGPRLGPGPEATALTGIAESHPSDSLPALVNGRMLAESAALFVEKGAALEDDDWVEDQVNSPAVGTVRDLGREVAALRLIKDGDELRRLRKAIDITAEAHRAAMAAAKPGMSEYELEAIIEYTFRRMGAERVGFPSIIGSGPNSTTLHYDVNRRLTKPGDLVVMDIGAEYGYFSADVTRTVPVSGRFTPRQRQIYELVLATQQAAIDSVRPGMTVRGLNTIARDYMKAHSGALCGATTCDTYFVHGLSHWLGMDVHDVGDYSTPFAPGMVLTVEPGIYLPEEELGVRIEDDVLVTEQGHELLSGRSPRTVAEIEKAMKEDGRTVSR